jgi:hypothetical protein
VAAISDSGARLNDLLHVADRTCIGRCFSYGNYEPATGQFRIVITSPNQVVAKDMTVVQEIEEGQHIVTQSEDPLYSVCGTEGEPGRFYIRQIHAGERTCAFSQPISVRLGLEHWLSTLSMNTVN